MITVTLVAVPARWCGHACSRACFVAGKACAPVALQHCNVQRRRRPLHQIKKALPSGLYSRPSAEHGCRARLFRPRLHTYHARLHRLWINNGCNTIVLFVLQRPFHFAPTFRLLLKVALKGAHQCGSNNFWLEHSPTSVRCDEKKAFE
jgi:hypothetical protein